MRIFVIHQFRIFLILLLVFFVSFLFSYFMHLFLSVPHGSATLNLEELATCNNNFCELLKKVRQHPNNVFQNGYDIFINNLVGTYYILISKPLFLKPLLDTVYWGSLFGTFLFDAPKSFLTEVLFPHGWIEISSFLIIYSYFYAAVVNIFIFIRKLYFRQKVYSLFKNFCLKSIYQISLFILLLLLAGILEAIGISFKA